MTLAVFALIQLTPGGRLGMALMEARMKEGGRATNLQSSGLTPGQILKLEEQFGHDKPFPIAYLSWLGAVPRETNRSRAEFAAEATETAVKIPGTAEVVSVRRLPNGPPQNVAKAGLYPNSWPPRLLTPHCHRSHGIAHLGTGIVLASIQREEDHGSRPLASWFAFHPPQRLTAGEEQERADADFAKNLQLQMQLQMQGEAHAPHGQQQVS